MTTWRAAGDGEETVWGHRLCKGCVCDTRTSLLPTFYGPYLNQQVNCPCLNSMLTRCWCGVSATRGRTQPITLLLSHMFVSCKSGKGPLLRDSQVPQSKKASICKGTCLEGWLSQVGTDQVKPWLLSSFPSLCPGVHSTVSTTKTPLGLQLHPLASQALHVLLL